MKNPRNCIPDPDGSGYLKYDPYSGEYEKLLKVEAQKRIELMEQIIKSREGKERK